MPVTLQALLCIASCLKSGESLESVHKFGHVAFVLVDVEGSKNHGVLVPVPVHDHLRLGLAHHADATELLEQLLQACTLSWG